MVSRTKEQQVVDSTPTQYMRYRGQTIERNDTVPIDRRGRYVWSGRAFAQLNHAKTAINDHYRQHAADERDRYVDDSTRS